MTVLLDGKKIADEIKSELKEEVLKLKEKRITPGLAVILAGKDPASKLYVKSKEKTCRELGIYSRVIRFDKSVTEEEILGKINELNKDRDIHGILVQLPLPPQMDKQKIISVINPQKDVDCFNSENIGQIFLGNSCFLPCTPAGILELLKRYEIEISGKNITIVGRSNIVGKPLALMLINEGATVTVCNSKTCDLKAKCLDADILVSAAGNPGLIRADMVKPNAVVVDVGINRNENGKLEGDVKFSEVSQIAAAITPVPGGVGPMTIVMLMKNTVLATKNTNL